MKEFLSRAFALTFTAAISERLVAPKVVGLGVPASPFNQVWKGPAFYRAQGHLPLQTHRETGETVVPVRILVPPDWMGTPPIVYVAAPFIRREVDWHVQVDGSLCHVLPHHWSWEIEQSWQRDPDMSRLVEIAAEWCCQNVDSLVTRHLHGYRFGLTKWPKLWAQWGHGAIGITEFQASLTKVTREAA